MPLTQKEFDSFWKSLEVTCPKITLVCGINNKSTFFQADEIYDVLMNFVHK
jgi:hypothetical protein